MQFRFAKYLLGVNKGATNMAVLSELGLDPISIDALKLAIGFLHHVINTTIEIVRMVINSAPIVNLKLSMHNKKGYS